MTKKYTDVYVYPTLPTFFYPNNIDLKTKFVQERC